MDIVTWLLAHEDTEEMVKEAISLGFEPIVVNELPPIGDKHKLYLVSRSNTDDSNIYDEYIWIESAQVYEPVGNTGMMIPPYIVSDSEPTDHGPLWIDPSDHSVPQGTEAEYISYDPTASGLDAENVQDAVDELAEAISEKADKAPVKTAMDAVAVAGAQYYLGIQSAVSIVLPSDAEVGQQISVVFYSGDTAATLTISGTMLDVSYTPSVNSRSEINALWDGTYWSIVTNEQAVPEETA